MKNIHDLLDENGYFIFDFNTDKLFEDKHRGIMTRTAAGISYNQICEYNKDHRIAKTIFDFGRGIKEVHIQRAYNYHEIEDSLKSNDFEIKYSLACIIHKPGSIWGEGRDGLAPEVPLWSVRPTLPSPLKETTILSIQIRIYEQ